MFTAVFYSVPTVCQYLTIFCSVSLCKLSSSKVCTLSVSSSHYTGLYHYAHCCFLQFVHCLLVTNTLLFCNTMLTADFYSLPAVCHYLTFYFSLSLCELPSYIVYPLSVSTSHPIYLCHYVNCLHLGFVHCSPLYLTVLLCVTMPTAVFYSLSTVSQYITLYRSVLLCQLISSKICPHTVSISHCTALCHNTLFCLLVSVHCLSGPYTLLSCVTMYTAIFYSLSTICLFHTLYWSVSLCPLLSSTVCPRFVSTSHCTFL
jgi:hypothetical protein